MSDLVKEAAPSLSPVTDLKNQAANKRKLLALSSRATSAGGLAGDQASMLVDAFSEVFASMSISSPAPIESSDDAWEHSNSSEGAVQATDQSGESEQDESQQNLSDDTVKGTNELETTELAVQLSAAKTIESEVAAEDVSVLEVDLETTDEVVAVEAEDETTEVAQLAVASTMTQASSDFEVGDQVDHASSKDTESVDKTVANATVDTDASKAVTKQNTTTTENQSDASESVDLNQGETTGGQSDDQPESENRRRYSKGDGPADVQLASNASEKAVSATKATTIGLDQQSESPLNSMTGNTEARAGDRPAAPTAAAAASANAAVAAVSSASSSSAVSSRGAVSGVNGAGGGNNGVSATSGIRPPGTGAEQAGRPEWAANDNSAKKTDAGATKTDTLTRIKLVQRVSRAFQHLGPEGGVVRLRLAPAELGTVRVEMQIQQKKVNARVVAETDAATSALREHLPELRARLEAHGMQIESLDVETQAGDADSSALDHRSQEDPRRETPSRSNRASQPGTTKKDRAVPAPVSRQPVSLASAGGVDIRF